MTLPTIVPTGYDGTVADFLKTKVDRSGAHRNVAGSVSVPTTTAATTIVGLVPFNKGALITLNDKSIYAGNFGAATTTIDVGIVYSDNTNNTNDVDAFVSASTAPQAGGFVTIDEKEGLTLKTTADGWLAVTINTADADATASILFNAGITYDGLA